MDSMTYAYASSAFDAMVGVMTAIYAMMLIFTVLLIVAQWRLFSKAGEKGWKSLIPIYNMVTLYKIIGLSPWLLLVYLASVIPVVGYIAIFVLTIVSMIKLGQAFGKSTGFIVGLVLLSPIFQLILGFGSSEYVGKSNN